LKSLTKSQPLTQSGSQWTSLFGDERYLAVAQNARQVAILEAGAPVVAFGGFAGRDPILTIGDFAKMAAENQFRYVMLQPK
jgi:DICT domain-containing protein